MSRPTDGHYFQRPTSFFLSANDTVDEPYDDDDQPYEDSLEVDKSTINGHNHQHEFARPVLATYNQHLNQQNGYIDNNFIAHSQQKGSAARHFDNSLMVATDEEDDDDQENLIMEGRPHFKLPPRLRARLQQQKQQTKSVGIEENGAIREPRVLQNVENMPPLLMRRDTFFCRKGPAKLSARDAKKGFEETNQTNALKDLNETFEMPAPVKWPNRTYLNLDEEDARYINWLNSAIMVSFNIENISVDVRRIINDVIMSADQANAGPVIEPLKDGVSTIAYKEKKLMEALRIKAQQLYSERMPVVEELLANDLKVGKFYVRKDKNIHADVGAKKHIIEIFLNYNPLWLKVALECVFQERIDPSGKRSEMHTLLHVLTAKLLSFKKLALSKGAKSVITYFMKEPNVVAAKRHILYNFLRLVHFLDVAKRARLIDHDPCLFRIDAECKSSRDILVAFSREYITGVGDITKALRGVGIDLMHVQLPIEQFNFTVTKLSHDIRDGVRLARLAEIMLQRNDILPKLQFPPDSITRKIHNMELVFRIFEPHFLTPLPKSVMAREVANGSRAKTIILLDKLIEMYNERLRLLELQQLADYAVKIQRWWRRHLACKAQREHFVQLRTTTIWVQRQFRAKLETMELRNEFLQLRFAAITIQRRFRANQAMKVERRRFLEMQSAAVTIQRYIRAYLAMKTQREQYLRLRAATVFVQQRWRQNKLAKEDRAAYLAKRQAIMALQTAARAFLARKRFARLRELTNAAIVVQRHFRATRQMRKDREQFAMMRRSAMTIQRFYRGYRFMLAARAEFIQKREAAVVVQRYWRGYVARKRFLEVREKTITIQRHFRSWQQMKVCRAAFLELKHKVVMVQQKWRLNRQVKLDRAAFLKQKQSAIVIQRAFCAHLERKRFLELRQAAITVQRRWRANQEARCQREEFLRMKSATIRIQRAWRQYRRRKELTAAALVVQRRFRANQAMKQCRAEFVAKREAVLLIQRKFRAVVVGRQEREQFLQQRQAAITIQRCFREKRNGNRFFYVVQQYYQLSQFAATKIQSAWRGYRSRKEMDACLPALPIYRQRIAAANENATEEMSIHSLMLLIMERINRCKSINSLYKDFEAIESFTDVSSEICQIIIDNHWLIDDVLLGAIEQLNRSEPHKKVLSNVLGIIINLMRKTSTELLYGRLDIFKMAMKVVRQINQNNIKTGTSSVLISRVIGLLLCLFQHEPSRRMFKTDPGSIDFLLNFLKVITSKKSNGFKATSSSSNLITEGNSLLRLLNKN